MLDKPRRLGCRGWRRHPSRPPLPLVLAAATVVASTTGRLGDVPGRPFRAPGVSFGQPPSRPGLNAPHRPQTMHRPGILRPASCPWVVRSSRLSLPYGERRRPARPDRSLATGAIRRSGTPSSPRPAVSRALPKCRRPCRTNTARPVRGSFRTALPWVCTRQGPLIAVTRRPSDAVPASARLATVPVTPHVVVARAARRIADSSCGDPTTSASGARPTPKANGLADSDGARRTPTSCSPSAVAALTVVGSRWFPSRRPITTIRSSTRPGTCSTPWASGATTISP